MSELRKSVKVHNKNVSLNREVMYLRLNGCECIKVYMNSENSFF